MKLCASSKRHVITVADFIALIGENKNKQKKNQNKYRKILPGIETWNWIKT